MSQTFSANIAAFAEKFKLNHKTVVQKVCLLAFEGCVFKTPVRTGRARANWGCAIGQPITNKSTLSVDKDGSGTFSIIKGVVSKFDGVGSIFLTNNVAYIGVLEYGLFPNPPKSGSYVKGLGKGKTVRNQFLSSGGYSIQAPNGMVRITAMEVADQINSVVG